MERYRLHVTTPDGQVREYPITDDDTTVGRAKSNGIVLEPISVELRHLRLQVKEGRIYAEDLGSQTGTFIGGYRLTPGEPVAVDEGVEMLLGDVRAVVVPTAGQSTGQRTGGGAAEEAPQTFALRIDPPTDPIRAGASAVATIRLENRANTTDEFSIRVTDHPGDWIQVTRPQVSLSAGTGVDITLIIRPPQSPVATAGDHSFAVAVTSNRYQREVRSLARYSIERFERITVRLQPSRTRGQFRTILANQGNAVVTYSLDGQEPSQSLEFGFEPRALEIPPGGEGSFDCVAGLAKRDLFGRARAMRFNVRAVPAGSATAEEAASGQLDVRPPLRHWRIWLVALGLGSLLAFGSGAYIARGGFDNPFGGGGSGGGGGETPTATATEPTAETTTPGTETTEPSVTVTPEGLFKGGRAVASNLGGEHLNVRAEPTVNSALLDQLNEGDVVDLLSDRTTDSSGSFHWWQVRTPRGIVGWTAEGPADGSETWLTPVP